MRLAVLHAVPWDCPTATLEVDLVPLHTLDSTSSLSGENNHPSKCPRARPEPVSSPPYFNNAIVVGRPRSWFGWRGYVLGHRQGHALNQPHGVRIPHEGPDD